jgi:hypothetical protein
LLAGTDVVRFDHSSAGTTRDLSSADLAPVSEADRTLLPTDRPLTAINPLVERAADFPQRAAE